MGSPTRIFKGLSLAELQELKSGALSRIANGDLTSGSGGGKSHSKRYAMDPQDVLFEANYEIGVLEGNGHRSKVYQDFTGQNNDPLNPLYIP